MSVPTGVTPPEATPAQGTPGQGQAQPQAGGTGGGGFNWGLFPDVPENQRAALEPHLKNVLGHVTRLEQQLAPFKPLIDSGLDANRLQGLSNFAQQFQENPLETWLGMGSQLQEAGVVHEMLNLQELQAISQGIDTDQQQPGQQQVPGQQQPPDNGEIPPWAQQLTQRLDQMQNQSQQEQEQRQIRIQDALLERQITRVKGQLTEAGVKLPEDDAAAQRLIVGHIIAHAGNVDQAVQAITGFRESNLQAAVGQRQPKPGSEPTMPRGTPPAPPRNPEGPPPRDGFAATRGAATQFLEQQAQASAEEGS